MDLHRGALAEIGAALERVDPVAIDGACAAIADARRVVVYGCGREALQIKGFAMRLFHLGLDVSVVGEMTAAPVGPGDLFVATSGPGELVTVLALLERARAAGSDTLVLTAEPAGSAARAADRVLVVPARTMSGDQGDVETSVLPLGSVYEGALFVLFEILVDRIGARLGVTKTGMRARHTNLE